MQCNIRLFYIIESHFASFFDLIRNRYIYKNTFVNIQCIGNEAIIATDLTVSMIPIISGVQLRLYPIKSAVISAIASMELKNGAHAFS